MSSPRGRKPAHVSDIVESLSHSYRLPERLHAYAAFPHWPEIVGEKIASISVPEKLNRNSVLVVRVTTPAWVQELTLQKAEILNKIAQFGGGAPVNDIRFISGNPSRAKK